MTGSVQRVAIPSAALILGLAGLVPFFAGAVSLWLPLWSLPPDSGLKLITIYGAIIVSFLGGIRWGTAIGPSDPNFQGMEFVTSVLGPLAALAVIFLPPVPGLTLLIGGFLLQAFWDVTSVESGRLPLWFGKLRMMLTVGAVLSLMAALIAVIT